MMSSSSDTASPPDSDTSSDYSPPANSGSSADASPPPPPSEDSSQSPPPPKDDSSPPPPPDESSSSASPPPPPSDNASKKESPPPPPTRYSDGNSGKNRPPPPNKHSSSSDSAPPPPPSRSSRALSPPDKNDSPPKGSSGGGSNDQAIIIGVVVGAVVVLAALVIICVVCCKKRTKKGQRMQYYENPSFGNKAGPGSDYYYSGQHPIWQNGSAGNDHVVRMQDSGPPTSGGSWVAGPPPPPPMSADMSSTYSGPRPHPLPPPSPGVSLGFNKSSFSYDELQAATTGFSQVNLLGQGGFGYVHKGVLPDGREIAVKSLKSGSGQGEREFQAEVDIISRVHHKHLVSLVGYCIAGGQRMLVYEFVPNKTLEHHLHGKGLPTMDWPTRLRIAMGSAKGLAYLHEDCHPRIIHRDIKSANILLDYNFEAKVADFGLAKLSSDNYTHVSTRVMGTFGYLAPEYASSGKLTEKSDVFSYGVMLLELITGKQPVDPNNVMEDSLVDWARPLLSHGLEDGNFGELVDPFLENNYNPQEMRRMAACAAASIRHSARKRPKMSQVVRALEGDVSLDDLNEGVRPGQSTYFGSGVASAEYDQFRKIALSSQEFGSSETSSDSRDMNHQETQRHHF